VCSRVHFSPTHLLPFLKSFRVKEKKEFCFSTTLLLLLHYYTTTLLHYSRTLCFSAWVAHRSLSPCPHALCGYYFFVNVCETKDLFADKYSKYACVCVNKNLLYTTPHLCKKKDHRPDYHSILALLAVSQGTIKLKKCIFLKQHAKS